MFLGTVVYAFFDAAVLVVMALGFNLTFGISGVANFAYGAMYIMAAYLNWMFLHFLYLPYWLSTLISISVTMALAALMYQFVLLRVRGQVLSEVIATFGIGLAVIEMFHFLGYVGYEYTLPVLIDRSLIFGNVVVDMQRVAITAVAALLVIGLWAFTHHTRIGLAFRGIAQDERTALTFGIDSDRIGMLSVSLGCGLAALAAAVIIPLGSISPDEGYDVLMNALAICIIGGLGSTGGVILAGLFIGFAERFTDTYVSSSWTMVVSLAAMLIILLIKPSGFLGRQKELEERI